MPWPLRSLLSTREEHLTDHNTAGDLLDILEGSTGPSVPSAYVKVRDSLGVSFVYQKSGVTAGSVVTMGSITGALVDYVVPRAGRLIGLSVLSGSTVTAGTVTATVQKNAVDTALTAQLSTTNNRSRTTERAYEDGIAVSAGDLLRITLAASANFTPTAAIFNAHAYYVPDPVSP